MISFDFRKPKKDEPEPKLKIFKITVCAISGKMLDTGCLILNKIKIVSF